MADHSVGARDELNESEASQALMFCFDKAFPEKSRFALSIWSLCFALPTRFCVPECHRNRVESSTAEKVFFFFSFFVRVGEGTKETEAKSSRSPKELSKFRLESILENV